MKPQASYRIEFTVNSAAWGSAERERWRARLVVTAGARRSMLRARIIHLRPHHTEHGRPVRDEVQPTCGIESSINNGMCA
jgi:hypothetical protein